MADWKNIGMKYWADFTAGVSDEKGRPIGACATVREYGVDTTERFYASAQATRSGVTYGATPRGKYFQTLEEAKMFAEQKAQETCRRYQKKGTAAQQRAKAPAKTCVCGIPFGQHTVEQAAACANERS